MLFGNRTAGGIGGIGGVGVGATAPLAAAAQGSVELPSPPDDTVSCLRWSPAGCPMLLVGATSWDKTVRVWQVQPQPVGGRLQVPTMMGGQNGTAPLLCLSFAADGRVFYGGCCRTGQMWNLQTQQKQQVAAHDLPISCMTYVAASQAVPQEMLITGSWDGKLRFWDLRQQAPAKEENLGAPIVALDVKGPMASIATGRKVTIMNLQSFTRMGDLQPNAMMKYAFRDVACFPSNTGVLVGSAEGRLGRIPLTPMPNDPGCCFKAHAVETPGLKNHYTMFQTNFVATVSEGTAVTGGSDGYVRFWNMTARTRIAEFAPKMHGTVAVPVSCGGLSSDSSFLAYGTSYDWSMGKDNFDSSMPRAITVMPVNPSWIR